MALSWLACDFVTGRVLGDLPGMTAQSPLRTSIGQYEQNTLMLPLATAPHDWLALIRPKATNLIALNEAGNPVWGGIVTQLPRDTGDSLSLPVVSAEAYFDWRYISPAASTTVKTVDHGYYTNWDQCEMTADLVQRYAATATRPGMPVRTVWTPSAQPPRSQTYLDTDDKTLYSGLQDFSALLNGPEWILTWEWQHNPERITPVFTVADRIGRSPRPGLNPEVFHLPGSISAVQFLQDYTNGKGANDVTAVGSGDGTSRLTFREVAKNFGGRPTIEFRFNVPSAGQPGPVQESRVLRDYASQALSYMGDGAKSLTLTADIGSAPVLGEDWEIGDDLAYEIDPFDGAGNTMLAFPDGLSGVARSIGAERTDTTIAPILWLGAPEYTTGSS